ncbi:cytochrome P450 [Nocardia sp. NPDC020380]|uniref:cytochrome P450 n=1 Tax=Nocardia sp. NPDC020380 TaxID=3364309 RepID=UPI00378735E5
MDNNIDSVPADRCPVDHTAPAAPASAAARPAIPATDLPKVQLSTLRQLFEYWRRPPGFLEECRRRYGSRFAVSIRLPPKPVYLLTDTADIKQLFTAPADVLHTGNGSISIEKYTGGSGLAWLDEDEHKVRRRLLMPSMNGKALRRIEASVNELADRAVATWPRGRAIELHPLIHRYSLQSIGEVIFGELPSNFDEILEVMTDMMRFNDHIMSVVPIHKLPRPLFMLLEAIRPVGLHDFLTLRARADELIAQAIAERRSSGELGDDMLSVLLGITHEDGSPLSGTELRDEMMTIFIAGVETTAAAITWALEYLSREPAVVERLVSEIDAGTDDTYLMATIHELLRLRPSLSQIIPREVMKPIEIGGVRYEPGMILWGSAYLMNRDPDLYEDPDVFRPERFLGAKPGTYTWIPFGGGRIRCLGDKVAILEMKALLRAVLTQCELRRSDSEPAGARSRIVVVLPEKRGRLELRSRRRSATTAVAG